MDRPVFSRRAMLMGSVASAGLATIRRAQGQAASTKATRHPLLETQHPGIGKARDAALAVLKPTPAQLERGLELHARSLVFDSYGFAPRAGLNVEQFQAAIAAGSSDDVLNDLRETMTMTRAAIDSKEHE